MREIAAEQLLIDELARTYARIAKEGFTTSARYFRTLPAEAWSGPTGCAEWDMRYLAGHIAGEAVWFPNLVRGVTEGEAPHPVELYTQFYTMPIEELADRAEQAAADIQAVIAAAEDDQLRQPVDMGFFQPPIWQATTISASEAVFHEWDMRARREDRATIPTAWAVIMAGVMPDMGPMIAHRDGTAAAPGTYLLEVGDDVGPVTIVAGHGKVTVTPGEHGAPGVTLVLSADQYVRLLTGRFDLDSAEGQDVRIAGDAARAKGLNQIFSGIANG